MKPNKMIIFAGMGFEIVGLILGSFFLGQIIDDKFGTKGIAIGVLTFAALVSWLVRITMLVKRFEKEEIEKEK
jgi:hypothetical protein